MWSPPGAGQSPCMAWPRSCPTRPGWPWGCPWLPPPRSSQTLSWRSESLSWVSGSASVSPKCWSLFHNHQEDMRLSSPSCFPIQDFWCETFYKKIKLYPYFERKVVWTDLIGASKCDHVIGRGWLPGRPLRLLLHQTHGLPRLQLPEARHHQLGVQVPAEHVLLWAC